MRGNVKSYTASRFLVQEAGLRLVKLGNVGTEMSLMVVGSHG